MTLYFCMLKKNTFLKMLYIIRKKIHPSSSTFLQIKYYFLLPFLKGIIPYLFKIFHICPKDT